MKLLKFEWKKIWKHKKLLILFLVIIAWVLGVFIRNELMQKEIEFNLYNFIGPHHEEVPSTIKKYEKEIENNPENKNLQEIVANLYKMETALMGLEYLISNADWYAYPEKELEFLELVFTHIALGGEYDRFQGYELEQRIEKNKILINNQLPYEDEQYSLAMPNFMKIAATLLLSIIGVIILVFIMGDHLSDEFENQTIRYLYTQPLQKWQVLFAKYISLLLTVLFLLFILFIASALIPYLFGGREGSFTYPQLVQYSDGFDYITTGEYLVGISILYIGASCFAFSLLMLFSYLFKNRFTTILVLIVVSSCGALITNQFGRLQNAFNPFYYFDIASIMERPDSIGGLSNIWVIVAYSILVLLLCIFIQGKGQNFQLGSPNKRPFYKGNTIQSKNKQLAILLFEWRKFSRQGFIKQMVLVLFILLIGGYGLLTYQVEQYKSQYVETLQNIVSSIEKWVQTEEEMLRETQEKLAELEKNSEEPLTPGEKDIIDRTKAHVLQLEANFTHAENELKQSKDVYDAYLAKEWPSFYDYYIYQAKLWKGEIRLEHIGFQRYLSVFSYDASIAEKEVLAKENIEPVLPPDNLLTIYDKSYQPERIGRLDFLEGSQKKDNTGLFYLYKFFDSYLYLLPLLLLVFLFGGGFTSEKGKKRTLNLLETQPLSKYKIYLGKTSVALGLTLGIGFFLILFMVLIGSIWNRFGDWNFPVLFYDTKSQFDSLDYTGFTSVEGGFYFIQMGEYLSLASLLFLGVLLFLIAVSMMFSNLFNNMLSSFTLVVCISISGYLISVLPVFSSMAHLSPFTYLNIGKIVNGQIATILNNEMINVGVGLIVLVVYSFLWLGVGMLIYKKPAARRKSHRW